MDPIIQKLENWHRHKKAISTFHHINYQHPQQFQKRHSKQRQDFIGSNLHKRAKSFSKQSHRFQSNAQHYIQRLNGKYSDQIKAQFLNPHKRPRNQKSLKQKKEDFIRDYIKSESESRRHKKRQKSKVQVRAANSSPDNRSSSKSGSKTKVIKEAKIIKLKPEPKQRNAHSKQVSRYKNSKDSKTSRESGQRNSEQLRNINKMHQKRQLENKLGRQKKGIQINFKNISLKGSDGNCQRFPMTPEQVGQCFKDLLNKTQVEQMKQYKLVYFLGRDFESKSKTVVFSARENARGRIYNEQDATINHSKNHEYFETQNIPIDKKPFQDSEYNSQFYQYTIGQHIAYRYEIISSINRGSFGEVLKVFDHKNKQFLAIKVVKKSKELVQQTFVEISILTHVKQNDKGITSGIVRIRDFLLFRNHILLDGNLYELLTANGFKGFSQDVIRLFAVQILNSLNFLRREKIIHCDIKPENLVMKNWGKSGIKLIDFGTSCFQGKQMYSYLQSRYYRAPQVFMQMPYSFPIDMWSFGCLVAEFKMGEPLFSGRSTIQQLVYIYSCIGSPNKHDGLFSLAFLENQMFKQIIENNYLDQNRQTGFSMGADLFMHKYNQKLKKQCIGTLQQRLSKKGSLNPAFQDFLEKIIVWEPDKRLTPQQALRHPWITKGLSSQIYSLYSSFNTVQSCSKSKKNSKDSKKSNHSRERSSNQKDKKLRNGHLAKTNLEDNQRGRQQNKINFGQKKGAKEQNILNGKDCFNTMQGNNGDKKVKLNGFTGKNKI